MTSRHGCHYIIITTSSGNSSILLTRGLTEVMLCRPGDSTPMNQGFLVPYLKPVVSNMGAKIESDYNLD